MGAHTARQHPRHVALEAAARDVDEAMDLEVPDEVEQRLYVDPGRREQRAREARPQLRRLAEEVDRPGLDPGVEHRAHERVAVAVESARGDPDQHVALGDVRPVDHPVAFDDAHAETHELDVALRVHPGHRRRLAAEQRTARAPAALGDTPQRIAGDRLREVAHRDVVEKDDRLGTLDDQVVHDHRDTVDPDRVVAADPGRELQLGPDAVGCRDEDRILVAVGGLEHSGEAADRAQDFGAEGALRDLLDVVDEGLVVVEIHAGPGVRRGSSRGEGFVVGLGGSRHEREIGNGPFPVNRIHAPGGVRPQAAAFAAAPRHPG